MDDLSDIAAVIEAENRRCQAGADGEWDVLESCYGREFQHLHQNGTVGVLSDELQGFRTRHRMTERPDVSVDIYGDVALMAGYPVIRFDDGSSGLPGIHFFQVWVRRDGGWKLVRTHSAIHPVKE